MGIACQLQMELFTNPSKLEAPKAHSLTLGTLAHF